jgi:hypothetical protein
MDSEEVGDAAPTASVVATATAAAATATETLHVLKLSQSRITSGPIQWTLPLPK